ncbi:RhuM family protein [Holdemanella biformis]|uniref:RhuM family protein n=1 Tax=Holdemanella biformis TaxID=1735 RepID=UPI003A5232B8
MKSEELDKNSVCSYFEHTASDGKIYKTQYYNLDMIISVGYRVNYKKVTSFKQCATSILRNYMINGYAVNQIRDILPVL